MAIPTTSGELLLVVVHELVAMSRFLSLS
jgi:hypothetical protein